MADTAPAPALQRTPAAGAAAGERASLWRSRLARRQGQRGRLRPSRAWVRAPGAAAWRQPPRPAAAEGAEKSPYAKLVSRVRAQLSRIRYAS